MNISTLLKCFALSGFSIPILADETGVDFSLEARAGYVSDSAVGVDELERNSRKSDQAYSWQVKPEIHLRPAEKWEITASYNRSWTNYRTLDSYDLDIADLALSAQYKANIGDVGYRFDSVSADLGGSEFLDMNMHNVNWGNMIGKHHYLRFSYLFKDKDYIGLEERDATNHGVSSQLFLFSKNLKNILIVSATLENEQAEVSAYDYNAWQVSVSLNRKFKVMVHDAEIKLRAQYRSQSYDSTERINIFNPDLGRAARDDSATTLSAELKYIVNDNLSLISSLESLDQRSNLDAAEFDRTLARLRLQINY